MTSPSFLLRAINYSGSGDWNDESGNGYSATLAAGTIAKNSAGNGIVFDGSTYWTVPNLQLGSTWTLSSWYKDNGTTAGQSCIITQEWTGTSINAILGYYENNSIAGAFFNQGTTGWSKGELIPVESVMTHYAISWDGSSMRFYKDSVLVDVSILSGTATDSGNPYYIGSDWGFSCRIIGEIGEIRAYNYAATHEKIAADYNESLSTFRQVNPPSTKPLCFLADAPVLTSNGYVRIDSVQVGDRVITPKGDFKITKLFCETYPPGPDTNPYIIPDGRFGAIGNLRISPRHRVLANGRMIEARDLCLEQEDWVGPVTYHNIEIEGGHHILVGGVEVESLIPVSLHRISGEAFQHVLDNQYAGIMTPEIKDSCYFFEDGSVAVHAVAR